MPLPPLRDLTDSVQHALHYGKSRTPLARVVPDAVHPGMWRIVWPAGSASDMVNLARAKDAAAAIAERGPPARNRRRLHWTKERSKFPPGASPMRFSGEDGPTDGEAGINASLPPIGALPTDEAESARGAAS